MINIRVNPNKEIAKVAREAVRANDGYCPCKIEKNADTKCMCKEFRDASDRGECGLCECGLYEVYEFYSTVCLCGSTKFKDKFMEVATQFTKDGWVVLMPNVWVHQGDSVTEEEAARLDSLHRYKISKADYVYVINVDGYIGESTQKEIEYAQLLGKEVRYLEEKE